MSTFSIKVSNFETESKEKAQKALQKVSMDLFRGIVKDTPVDTGRARANWVATVGAPAAKASDESPGGSAALAKAVSQASSVVNGAFSNDQSVFLTNNLPYIRRLEYGWSEKAPEGMVRINVERFKDSL